MTAPWGDFHFLRPWWLLAIIPALALALALRRRLNRFGPWSRVIDAALLPYLLDTRQPGNGGWLPVLLLPAWIFASLAMAGPAWERLPQPTHKRTDALVIVQDLSLSLYAGDLQPNRLTRAQRKLADILQWRKEGNTALIVYAGDAHVVTPLTEDTNTILAMVPALAPDIMPVYGSNVSAALALAVDLLAEAGPGAKDILLVTDEVTHGDVTTARDLFAGKEARLSVIGVGTVKGGPVLLPNGDFLRDEAGTVVVPGMNRPLLEKMAGDNGGGYRDISLTDDDFRALLAADAGPAMQQDGRRNGRMNDQWQDQGFWLLFPLLAVALGAFRRGWLLVLVLLLPIGQEASAASWDDLWSRGEQQAARAFAAGDFDTAAALFRLPGWKGAAAYRAGRYDEAAAAFGGDSSANGHYNRGNSLARLGRYDEAIAAYDQAVRLDPRHGDARFNRDLVDRLRRQRGQEEKRQRDSDAAGQARASGNGGQANGAPGQDHGEVSSRRRDGKSSGATAAREVDDPAAAQGAADPGSLERGQRHGETVNSDAAARNGDGEPGAPGAVAEDAGRLAKEGQQEMTQILRQVAENPGGLLRRKFAFEAERNGGGTARDDRGKFW